MRTTIIDQAILARDGFMTKSPSRVSTGLRVSTITAILPKPTIKHCQWDHGDCTSRALLAWLYIKNIVGETSACQEMEAGLWQHLKSLIVPQTGMVCVPEHSVPFSDKYYYHMWDQGRYFDYLVQRYQHPLTSSEQKKELGDMVRKFQESIYSLAIPHKLENGKIGLKWENDTYWNDSPNLPTDKDFGIYNFTNWCIVSSQLLSPQIQWAIVTGDDKDMDKAIQLANGFVAGLESPKRDSTSPMFGETGEFKGHVHGTLAGLIGLVKLAKYLINVNREVAQAEEWIALALRAYKWLFDSKHNKQIASSCGCIPEGMQLPWYSINSEICCTADVIELAVMLAEIASIDKKWSQLADLWDDVERFSRNELLYTQFTDISKVEKYLADFPDQNRNESIMILEKLVGTWVSSRTYLNELGAYRIYQKDPDFQLLVGDNGTVSSSIPMLDSGGCCAYSGIRGLYLPFMRAVVQNGNATEIRVVTSHDDDNVQINQISENAITFVAHRDCLLKFRKPSYASLESICVDGGVSDVSWRDDGRWVNINIQAGQSGTIKWEPVVWSIKEVFGPPNALGLFSGKELNERIEFTLSYRGNVLTKVEPAGKIHPYENGL